MFKTIKHIKKKILAAAMATAILVSGNIGTSSVISGNHSITGTAATVSAKTIIYLCTECDRTFKNEKKYYEHMASVHNADKCPYCGEFATRNRTVLENHKQTCPRKTKSYIKACPYNYDDKGCKKDTWDSPADYEKHLDECEYRNHCPFCKESFFDYGWYDPSLSAPLRVKSHVTYDCEKNENRQISEQNIFALENGKLPLPKWNVDKKEWECQWEGCKYHTPTEVVCVDHIIVKHEQDKAIDKKYGQYF